MTNPTRDDAWRLLTEWTPSEPLRKHGLAVEATVSWYAEHRFRHRRTGVGDVASRRPPARLRL